MTTIEIENTYTSGVYSKRSIAIVRGSGATLWDDEGREYIDCAAGHGVANIGHGRPEIAAALAAQAQRLITCPEIVYNDVRAHLLERLAHLMPHSMPTAPIPTARVGPTYWTGMGMESEYRIFLCNSGTEAVEGALKFARLATGRTGIVATLRSFHGRTMGALSATWEPHYREPFAPLLPGVSHIRYNDLAAAEAAINEETAAVLIELVQGEGGVHVATDAYVQGLANLCRERGALLIVDEVQTGFGRTGRLFACEHYDLQPDILCLAKSLAGGVPMGAICLGPRVIESGRITRGVHGSTFGGNPLACAAALATLDILEQEALPQRAATLGAYAMERLQAMHSPLIREVRGRGLLLGIELRQRAQPYLEALLEQGILALPAGPNVIRLLPPLVITEAQLERVLDAIEALLSLPAAVSRAVPAVSAVSAVSAAATRVPAAVSAVAVSAAARVPARGTPTMDGTTPDALVHGRGTLYGYPGGGYPGGDGDGGYPGDRNGREAAEVSLLREMLTIPSYSGQERALAQYLVEQTHLRGLHAWIDDAGNFIASTHTPEQSATEQPIVLLGHMDTVSGYIPVKLQDGLLYGRGAVDAKGPLAAFLCAAARLMGKGTGEGAMNWVPTLQRPVVVIGAVEEEAATSRGARAVVNRYQPHACIIGEPSGSQAVTIGYKGRLLVDYCVSRSVSHSAGPQQNSREVAVAFWNRVHDSADDWNRQHATNSAFAALLPSLRDIESDHDGFEEQARLRIGYRLPPDYDIATLQAQLEQWAADDGAQLRFSGAEQAFQTTRTTPLARTFVAAIRATGGQPVFKHKTGTSDMNVVGPVWGQNIVAYGPGDARLDHTPQEHIAVAEYMQAIDVLEAVLYEQASGRGQAVAPTNGERTGGRGQAVAPTNGE